MRTLNPTEGEDLIEPGSDPFEEELLRQEGRVRGQLQGSRMLVVGGAGTIGSATLKTLIRFEPSEVVVVDVSENGLAELARDIRSTEWPADLPVLEFVAIDYTSPLIDEVVRSGPFDHVLNFAALKHVRSERSPATLLRMFDVNVLGLARLMAKLSNGPHAAPARIFSVSTDKAADPANLMGASKRLMEAVLLAGGSRCGSEARTSARFANVAFSAGSLLESWTLRLQKGQPLACPADTRRFMISRRQSGRLCTLAAFALDGPVVGVPSNGAAVREWELLELARRYLASEGLSAEVLSDEAEARSSVERLRAQGRYPLVVTPLDTGGEKKVEVFVGAEERRVSVGLKVLDGVIPVEIDRASLDRFTESLERMVEGRSPLDKSQVVEHLAELLPRMAHRVSAAHLDERM